VASGGEEVVARTGREIWTTWIWFGWDFHSCVRWVSFTIDSLSVRDMNGQYK
jgi:hypothetical protein